MNSTPSTRSANLLYLLTTLLIITLGSFIQSKALSLGLIATEVFLILLPALLFIRAGNYPLRDTLRLHRPPLRLAILAMVIATGIWPFSLLLNSVSTQIFRYTPPTSAGLVPTNPWEAVLLFIGLAVAAPLCEEVVWRGYIQRAYESHGPWVSVGLVSLFFAFWHLRLQGLLSLLPLALMLGFLAWRSNSLLPGILAHFVANGLQVLAIILATFKLVSNTVLGIGVLVSAVLGIPVAMLGIYLFWKWTPRPAEEEPAARPAPHPVPVRTRLITLLPLLGVAAVYAYSAVMEVKLSTDPNALASQTHDTLQYEASPWTEPAVWEYQIRNIANSPVGTQTCTFTPGGTDIQGACIGLHQAYQVQTRGGTFMGGAGTSRNTFRWDRQTLGLLDAETVFEWDNGPVPSRSSVTRQGKDLVLTGTDSKNQPHQLVLPEKFLLDGEWQYRFSALAFGSFKSGTTLIAWPAHYVASINSDRPQTQPVGITVSGPETVSVPAGDFQAYRVDLTITGTDERQTAWYDVNAPHTLVKFDNSVESYLLVSVH